MNGYIEPESSFRTGSNMKNGSIPNLDDINKTAFCIPFDEEEHEEIDEALPSPHGLEARELEGGQELRFAAYRAAWRKCFDRMQNIIRELQSASAARVVKEVKESYINTLPGLPYPELPVVTVINPSLGSAFLDNITSLLEDDSDSSEPTQTSPCSVIHLYPADFPNITTGMRSIITGFLERDETVEHGKSRPTTALANYDIKLLVAWYKYHTSERMNKNSGRNLVAVLHDFEQYDPSVMQDVFHVFSGHVSKLPIVFVLAMSSPSSTFLNDSYPRATISLLRVRAFVAPVGPTILQELLLKTFFNVDFEPSIMIGPAMLEYLQNYFTRYNSSADAIYTILQLAHLSHFSSDPLTSLVHDTPLHALSKPKSLGFVDALSTRLIAQVNDDDVDMEGSATHTPATIQLAKQKIDDARNQFFVGFRNLRIGFNLILRVQKFLEAQGYKGLAGWSSEGNKGSNQSGGMLFMAMINVLRGNVEKDIKDLTLYTRKLNRDEVGDLLERIHSFFYDMPISISSAEQDARLPIVMLKTQLSSSKSQNNLEKAKEVAENLSNWLTEYLESKLVPLEQCILWDVWYTGLSPFPSEIINPSLRASMMAGLLRPHDYSLDLNAVMNGDPPAKALWELPDTSILFKRYLDSGKMINVYDWFESFKSVLDSQREQLKELSSPTKKTRRGAKAKKQVRPSEDAIDVDDEKWSIEVQARFIRAMHELDYLGFIKHTGRKADHLIRTVFDVDDAE